MNNYYLFFVKINNLKVSKIVKNKKKYIVFPADNAEEKQVVFHF